jgi:hypothetical protein
MVEDTNVEDHVLEARERPEIGGLAGPSPTDPRFSSLTTPRG